MMGLDETNRYEFRLIHV